MRINLIGDITGFYKTFKGLLDQLPEGELWGLGDLVDRGPSSKEVLEFFIDNGHNSIMGNHEHMMLYNNILYTAKGWAENGGDETVKNFGINNTYDFLISRIDPKFAYFLRQMPLKKELGNLILTHAPMNDNKNARLHDIAEINKDWALMGRSVLWNRLPPSKIEGKFQVYGHNSTKGILWHTDRNPQGIYMRHDPFEVPEGAWGVCLDTWQRGYLSGLHIETDLLDDPRKAITVYKQAIVDPYESFEEPKLKLSK